MKNIIYYLVLLVTPFGVLNAQQKKSALTEQNLKDKVRSVDVLHYSAEEKQGSVIKGNKTKRHYQVFNKNGYLIESLDENYDTKYSFKSIYTLDENNNIVKHEYYKNLGPGVATKIETTEYTYGTHGIIKEISYAEGILKYKLLYTYLDNGSKIQQDKYDGKGNLFYKKEEIVNKQKLVISSEAKNLFNQNTYSDAYKYDKWGNLIESVSSSSITFGWIETKTYTYNNLQQQVASYLNGSLEQTDEYDQHGNTVKSTYELGYNNTLKLSAEYVYDKRNNWIKVTTIISPGGMEIRERQMEYFD